MRFYLSVLLVAVTLVASTSVGSTAADATLTASHYLAHSPTENHDGVSTMRMLRTNRKQDDEERAGNVPISSKIINWAISPKSAEAKLTLGEKLKVEKWVFKKKKSNFVFNRLGLGGGVDKVLTNPKLHVYVSYIDRFNKQNPTKKVTMLDMFTRTYGDDAVTRMIAVAMNNPRTETFSTRMRQELLDSWKTQGKTAEDIFSLLKIDAAGYNLFKTPKMSKDSNPTLNLFAAYIDQLNKENPSKNVNMLDIFSKKYDDVAIAKMVEMGLKTPSTEKVSSKLRYELLSKWEDNVDKLDDVFKLLKLDKAGDDLFASPELKTLYSYAEMTRAWGSKEALLKVLIGHYGYDGLSKIFIMGERRMDMNFLAKDLETAMGTQWLKDKLSPDAVFELLKLNDDVNTFLTNPNFLRTWESYRTMFNLKNDAATTTMQTLRKYYKHEELSKMLNAAKEVSKTKKIAIKLLDELKVHRLRSPPMQKTS